MVTSAVPEAGSPMRALALVKPGHVEVVERPVPTFTPTEVLVRVLGVGVCGSDLSVYDGHRQVPELPWIMGHEAVGEVVAVGSQVTGRQVGQRVVVEPNYCCFTCAACLAGETSGCLNRVIVGMTSPGLLADYIALPAAFAHPAPKELDLDELICLEPYAVGVAASRRAQIQAGQSALVVGTGSTGLLLIMHLVEHGLDVYFVEPSAERAQLAEELGAKPFDPSSAPPIDQVFETSGTVPGTQSALATARPGGNVTLLGLAAEPAAIVPSAIVRNRLTIRGSMIYDHPIDFDYCMGNPPRSLKKIVRGEFPLEQAQKAFASARTVPGKSWISLVPMGENS